MGEIATVLVSAILIIVGFIEVERLVNAAEKISNELEGIKVIVIDDAEVNDVEVKEIDIDEEN